MPADLKTATSAIPSTLVSQSLATSDTTLYTCPVGATVKISSIRITNVDGSTRNVSLSIVKSGGTSGATNRIMTAEAVSAGTRVNLSGEGGDWLGEGDFISGFAPSSTNVNVTISGVVFSASSGAALTGIQDDAVGLGNVIPGAGTSITGTHVVGSGGNRYLLGALVVCHAVSNSAAWNTYDTLTMTCADGAMTRLSSANFASSFGSVHIFGRANPSNTSHTITANVSKSGVAFAQLSLQSVSYSGVASVTGAASTGPGSATTMSLPVTSALGHRVFFTGGFDIPPNALNLNYLRFDGTVNPSSNQPRWHATADKPGQTTVTATIANSTWHCAAAIDLVPA